MKQRAEYVRAPTWICWNQILGVLLASLEPADVVRRKRERPIFATSTVAYRATKLQLRKAKLCLPTVGSTAGDPPHVLHLLSEMSKQSICARPSQHIRYLKNCHGK